MEPLVIYHSPCLDGFTAAWVMWLKYPNAEFVPGVYGQAPPDCTGRKVYLLDFSYKLPVMKEIIKQALIVIVLDHHKTAEADLKSLFGGPDQEAVCGGTFDMNKSGARLAWEWLRPNTVVPRIVQYVEDRDLWRFILPWSKVINAALYSYDYDFKEWNALAQEMDVSSIDGPSGLDRFITEGTAIERKHMKDVRELVAKLEHTLFFHSLGGIGVPCANLPYTYASDAANLMALGAPFAATYFYDGEDYVFSLRSIECGTDVSEVAAYYGGGGHKHAAGFRISSLASL